MDLLRRALRAVTVDAALLRRRRDLRLLMIGQGVSLLGTAVTLVAIPVQMYDLTGSTVAVGLVGATQFVPILALALLGGALADAFDRRRLMITAELGSLTVTVALGVNALLPDPQLWVLYVASALLAGFMAILRPPLDALVPRLVERRELPAASALYGAVRNASSLGGPGARGRADRDRRLRGDLRPRRAHLLDLARRAVAAAHAAARRPTRSRRAGAGSSRASASRAPSPSSSAPT